MEKVFWAIHTAWAKYGFSSVQFSCSVMSNSLRPHGLQHNRPPCPSPTPGVYSNSCASSQWCRPTISSSVGPFSSCRPSAFSNCGQRRCDYRRQWLRRYNTTGFKDGARGPPAEESGRLQDLAQARIQKSFPRASRQEPALLTAWP